MKTSNLIKIAAVILLGVTLSVKAKAENDKINPGIRQVVSEVTDTFKFSIEGIANWETLLANPLEPWMFDSEYLNAEPVPSLEPWMFELKNFNEEQQPLEDWMFNETHLSPANHENSVEPWMFDANYLSR